MKIISVLIIALIITSSCNQIKSRSEQLTDSITEEKRVDSFSMAKYGRSKDEQIQHMVDSNISAAFIDTVGLYKAPVRVLQSKIVSKEYSNFRDIQLKYKNVSNKKIEGIKFNWYGLDAFGEPAEMGNDIVKGAGSGFADDNLVPSETMTSKWEINSRNAKKVLLAWPTEIAFSDGTKWKLKK